MKFHRIGLVLSLSLVAGVASAQHDPANPALKLAPQNQALKIMPVAPVALNFKPIAVPSDLGAVVAQKPLFDQSKLQGKLTYVGNIPQLKISSAKEVKLEPIGEKPPTFVPVNPTLKAQTAKFAPHYQVHYVGKARPDLHLKFKFEDVHENMAWQSPIKDQGSRGTCTAFASMAGLEWYYKKAYSMSLDLSEENAYNVFMGRVGSTCMADPGIRTVDAADYLQADRVCDEAQSPYVNSTSSACSVVQPACASNKKYGLTGNAKFFSPEFGGSGDEIATNTSYLEALVRLGFPVVLGLYVAGSDWSDGTANTGTIDVQKNSNGTPAAAYGGHALALVGYNSTQNYFIFKNSWGSDHGHAGYIHISYEYLQTYAKYGFVMIAIQNPSS